MIPDWLHTFAIVALLSGLACAALILRDLTRRPQHMRIMNVVWPITGLYAGPIALWGYFAYGRAGGHGDMQGHHDGGKPFPVIVGTGTTHCGAGCTLGDIIAEWLAFSAPTIAVWLGWHSLFAEKMFAVWILDFVFAFAIGIVFQYFAIVPMRDLSFRDGLIAALKADTLSLIAWQVGMYGFMAFAQFFWLAAAAPLEPNTPIFWFVMQIAMICGFITSYPVNWWLIKAGIKEEM